MKLTITSTVKMCESVRWTDAFCRCFWHSSNVDWALFKEDSHYFIYLSYKKNVWLKKSTEKTDHSCQKTKKLSHPALGWVYFPWVCILMKGVSPNTALFRPGPDVYDKQQIVTWICLGNFLPCLHLL